MVNGVWYYGGICVMVVDWLEWVEIDLGWIDDWLWQFLGGMQ